MYVLMIESRLKVLIYYNPSLRLKAFQWDEDICLVFSHCRRKVKDRKNKKEKEQCVKLNSSQVWRKQCYLHICKFPRKKLPHAHDYHLLLCYQICLILYINKNTSLNYFSNFYGQFITHMSFNVFSFLKKKLTKKATTRKNQGRLIMWCIRKTFFKWTISFPFLQRWDWLRLAIIGFSE